MKLNERARKEVEKEIQLCTQKGLFWPLGELRRPLESDNLTATDVSQTINSKQYVIDGCGVYHPFDFYLLEDETQVAVENEVDEFMGVFFVAMTKELKDHGSNIAYVAEAVAKNKGWM